METAGNRLIYIVLFSFGIILVHTQMVSGVNYIITHVGYAVIVTLTLAISINYKKLNYSLLLLLTSYYLLFLVSYAPTLKHNNVGIFIQYFMFSVIAIVLLYYYSNTKKINFIYSVIIYSAIISSLVIIVLSLDSGFRLSRYSGIYSNPNSMGQFAVTSLAVFIPLMIYRKHNGAFLNGVILVLTVMCLLFLLLSGSRTSFLAVSIVCVINLFMFYKLKVITGYKLLSYSLPLIIVLGIFFTVGLVDQIYYKTLETIEAGDVSQQRTTLWYNAFTNINLFGHGDEFEPLIGGSAHNTFISHMGQFGILSATLFYFPFLYGLYRSFKIAKRFTFHKDIKLIMIAISIFVSLFILSIFENMTVKPIIVYSLICLGLMHNKLFLKKP